MTELVIAHSSGKFNAPHGGKLDTWDQAFATEAHFVGFTELSRDADVRDLQAVANRHGYQLNAGTTLDCAVAARGDVQLVDVGSRFVHPGAHGGRANGGWAPRKITWTRGTVEGEDVWLGTGHWITRGKGPDRQRQRLHMAKVMADLLTENSAGPRLAFSTGDTNEVDHATENPRTTGRLFADHGVTTVYDELHEYPGTIGSLKGHRVIDWVCRPLADTRVTAESVTVRDQPVIDHNLVVARFRVGGHVPPAEEHACPLCGLMHTPILTSA